MPDVVLTGKNWAATAVKLVVLTACWAREGVVLQYVDGTQGWLPVNGINEGTEALEPVTYSADFLVIAGGGSGANFNFVGGGGAGGYRSSTQTLTANTASYTLNSHTVDITEAVIQKTNSDSSITDFELERISRDDYLKIPNKADTGRPSQYFLDKQVTPKVFLYPTPDSADVFKFNERRRIQDITASTETVDMPDRFLPCAVSGLAYYLALRRPQIEIQRRQELKLLYEEEIKRAMEDNREKVDMIIKPDLRYNI